MSGTNYALDEVVVTALGMKREKKALGYSVQDVKGDALIENRTANIATSLNGKVAGMNISATSIPGGSNRIVIRGNNSISGNNMPLVVVDGVRSIILRVWTMPLPTLGVQDSRIPVTDCQC